MRQIGEVMTQTMPVVRQLYRPALIPQYIAIAILVVAVRLIYPPVTLLGAALVGPLIYLLICRTTRALLVRDHTLGIRAYKAKHFDRAIEHFQASRDYFSAHPRLDACRSFLFGVACQTPYRVLSLGNMAFCHAQMGNRSKAIELYEQVLREDPDYALAKRMLNLLKAGPSPTDVVAPSIANNQPVENKP